jgi:hypothetical protein
VAVHSSAPESLLSMQSRHLLPERLVNYELRDGELIPLSS